MEIWHIISTENEYAVSLKIKKLLKSFLTYFLFTVYKKSNYFVALMYMFTRIWTIMKLIYKKEIRIVLVWN